MAKFSLTPLLIEWKPHTTYYFTPGIMKAFPFSACFFRDNKTYYGQGNVRDLLRTNVNERVPKFVLQLLEYILL